MRLDEFSHDVRFSRSRDPALSRDPERRHVLSSRGNARLHAFVPIGMDQTEVKLGAVLELKISQGPKISIIIAVDRHRHVNITDRSCHAFGDG